MTNKLRDSMWDKTYQIGLVVRDMDKAIEHFEALGIGPFQEGPSAYAVERRVYGKDMPENKVICRLAQMGPIEFELMQPITGPSLQQEFLDKHGEGVLHLCAYTDDIHKDIEAMTANGHEEIAYAKFDDGGICAHLETREIGGLSLELFERGSKWE